MHRTQILLEPEQYAELTATAAGERGSRPTWSGRCCVCSSGAVETAVWPRPLQRCSPTGARIRSCRPSQPSMPMTPMLRCEVWLIDLDPRVGAEIGKTGPALRRSSGLCRSLSGHAEAGTSC
jgi:hypothetical protein